jgi:hypothetical protein
MFTLLVFVPTLTNPDTESNLFKKIKVMRRKESRSVSDKSVQTGSDEVAVIGNDSHGDDRVNEVVGEFETELVAEELEYFVKIETL